MSLIKSVCEAIWEQFKTYDDAKFYITKWHRSEGDWNNSWENFQIILKSENKIDLAATLHSMQGSDLLKIAIDLGVDTPDFIPSIPVFKNEIKSNYTTAYDTFSRAYKIIEEDPSTAIGLANSALESIVKEILKDERFQNKFNPKETLYKLTTAILKEFSFIDNNHPLEIKTISSSFLAINQAVEKLRSEKTNFHGKTGDDHLISDSIYTHFILNSISTVGLFLINYYKKKFPETKKKDEDFLNDLPF